MSVYTIDEMPPLKVKQSVCPQPPYFLCSSTAFAGIRISPGNGNAISCNPHRGVTHGLVNLFDQRSRYLPGFVRTLQIDPWCHTEYKLIGMLFHMVTAKLQSYQRSFRSVRTSIIVTYLSLKSNLSHHTFLNSPTEIL